MDKVDDKIAKGETFSWEKSCGAIYFTHLQLLTLYRRGGTLFFGC